ncbi:hypothetical protein I6H52_04105 [Corynebacterium urealyticum]|uniref:hypothetical protein n=1 Tax=Corynebacterium urealyticum TaxID=43771 RepID=UPI0002B3FBD4|nr:hypothetical protein [Corynebacterium urealyticum]AGE37036.1 hypothetical protein CU7111_1450 [Corynebacterium urealyticum DSM 7111]QQB06920.1 hypothetical protein I6H53_06030 [Corynebacterium urealyticum]QQE51536.1 hypothetical protein I6H52_04105 [Corynebacterium urealyticum]TYR17465.1 hypothetical protein FYJ88_00940 [Corynebacterium urealyticum]TYT21517.1 hypothetical protein FYJ86_01705 [Corynebacterium urealyticum]
MEHWRLTHPSLGLIEVCVGQPAELRRVDPGFPLLKKDDADPGAAASSDGFVELEAPEGGAKVEVGELPATRPAEQHAVTGTEGEKENPDDGVRGKIAEKWQSFLEYEAPPVVVLQHGVAVYRERSLSQRKIRLAPAGRDPKQVADGEFSETLDPGVSAAPAMLKLDTAVFDRHLLQVGVKTKDSFIFFDPPAGTPAAERAAKMEASPVRRWLYPLLGGLGKSGWAILAVLLAPVLTKFLTWLIGLILTPIIAVIEFLQRLIPDINWPGIPWPEIRLPKIPWPDINWPTIPWPQIDLPSLPELPDWLVWLLDHPKFWVPIVMGAVVGIIAVRNARRSQKEKLHWQRQKMATALNALYEKRKMK